MVTTSSQIQEFHSNFYLMMLKIGVSGIVYNINIEYYVSRYGTASVKACHLSGSGAFYRKYLIGVFTLPVYCLPFYFVE